MAFSTGRPAAAVGAAALFAAAAALAAIASPAPARAQAQDAADQDRGFQGLVVQGSGEVQVAPDIARLSLGVETQGKEATAVAQDNARKTDALIGAVKAAGVAAKDIRTSGYSLTPQFDYSNQRAGKAPTIVGYTANNTVLVTVRKIADAGKIIDAAVQAGGNAASGISFDLNDDTRDTAQDAALQKAVAEATRKARAIAKAAGTGNLRLVAIEEGASAPPPIRPLYRMAAARAEAAPTTPIEAGETTVTATVTLRFTFSGPNVTP